MRISSVRVISFVFLLFCFDAMSMLERNSRAFQYVEPIILLKELGTSLSCAPQIPKGADSKFYLSAISSVTISGVEYPVFLSDDLKRELSRDGVENYELKQKLTERLQEIQQRDYSKSSVNISNFSLYLSDDKKEVYSMAFTEDDW